MITLVENNDVTESLIESIYIPNQEYFDEYTSNMGMEDNTQVLAAIKWKLIEDHGHGVEKVLSIIDDGEVVGLLEGIIDDSTVHTSINFSLVPLADFAEPLHTYLKSVGVTKIIAWAKPDTEDQTALLNGLNRADLYSLVTHDNSTFADGGITHSFITLNLL